MSNVYRLQAQEAESRHQIGVSAAAIWRFAESIAADVQRISSMPVYQVTADEALKGADTTLHAALLVVKLARSELEKKRPVLQAAE